ncbi:MAG: protein kinase [Bacilli bacterium]|nr:protein kinase [Bacilli bacterium]MDD4282238.1 protein kinase [Bacilli bacterium]MDD4718618.1 protein kinase [Bacilli bacterium]
MRNIHYTGEEFNKIKMNNKLFQGGEAKLYRHNHELLKIYHKFVVDDKEESLDYILTRDRINGCVLPNNKIYIDEEFRGVSIFYYENYVPIFKSIGCKEINYKNRLLICRQMAEAVKNLHENEIVHTDINLHNIIMNSNNDEALLIDNDSALPKELICKDDYQDEVRNDQYHLMVAVLTLAYDFNFERFIYKNDLNNFKEILSCFPIGRDLRKYIVNLIDNREKSEGYIDNYINDIKEGPVNKAVKLLIK